MEENIEEKSNLERVDSSMAKIRSVPPSGMCKVLNIYWNPRIKKLVIVYDDAPVS